MRSDHLACANCGGIVADGGCPVCRATRDELARQRFTLPTSLLAFLLAAIVLMIAYLAHHAG